MRCPRMSAAHAGDAAPGARGRDIRLPREGKGFRMPHPDAAGSGRTCRAFAPRSTSAPSSGADLSLRPRTTTRAAISSAAARDGWARTPPVRAWRRCRTPRRARGSDRSAGPTGDRRGILRRGCRRRRRCPQIPRHLRRGGRAAHTGSAVARVRRSPRRRRACVRPPRPSASDREETLPPRRVGGSGDPGQLLIVAEVHVGMGEEIQDAAVQRSSGSKLPSTDVESPAARARAKSAGASFHSADCRNQLPMCTCEAPSKEVGTVVRGGVADRSHRRQDRAVAVGSGVRCVDAPVGRDESTRTCDTSSPRRWSSRRMKSPNSSPPTTPTMVVGTPAAAAPHAVIAEELPIAAR